MYSYLGDNVRRMRETQKYADLPNRNLRERLDESCSGLDEENSAHRRTKAVLRKLDLQVEVALENTLCKLSEQNEDKYRRNRVGPVVPPRSSD